MRKRRRGGRVSGLPSLEAAEGVRARVNIHQVPWQSGNQSWKVREEQGSRSPECGVVPGDPEVGSARNVHSMAARAIIVRMITASANTY